MFLQKRCKNTEDSILLCLVIGMNFKSIQPLQRLIALKNLAGFLSLPQVRITLFKCLIVTNSIFLGCCVISASRKCIFLVNRLFSNI